MNYCKKCKYFYKEWDLIECRSPDNKIIERDCFAGKQYCKLREDPHVKNRNGQCSSFEPKPPFFSKEHASYNWYIIAVIIVLLFLSFYSLVRFIAVYMSI